MSSSLSMHTHGPTKTNDSAPTPAATLIWASLALLLILFATGYLMACALQPAEGTRYSIFYYLFSNYEPVAQVIFLLATLAAFLAATFLGSIHIRLFKDKPARVVHLLAWATLLISILGNSFIYQRYPLSMDEFAAVFQTRIFTSGYICYPVPEKWLFLAKSLTPLFVIFDPVQHTWTSPYLPGYSLFRSPFAFLKVDALANASLAFGSIYLVAAISRKLFPLVPYAPLVGAGLLACSGQFQINSMSYYSMPAHLFFNLLWFFFFLKKSHWNYLAAGIGAFAINLHQPNVHLLFAFPFFVHMLLKREWGRFSLYSATYGLGLGFALLWWHLFRTGADDQNLNLIHFPRIYQVIIQVLDLNLGFLWNSIPLFLFMAFSFQELKRDPLFLCLATGVVLSFTFYLFFDPTQGHGWGYRYIYPVLGNIVLLGVCGYVRLASKVEPAFLNRWTAWALLLSVLFLFPYRAWETYQTIRPFAQAEKIFHSYSTDIVLIENQRVWYGKDLIRNDPSLQIGPLLVPESSVTPEQLAILAKFSSTTHVTEKQLLESGLFPSPNLQ